jgi:peroxiredoxin
MVNALVVSTICLWVIVIGNLLLTLALVRRVAGSKISDRISTGPPAGEPVADFSAQMLGGDEVTMADFSSRPTIFVFVSSDCRACQNAMPRYRELCTSCDGGTVDVVMVSGDTPDGAKVLVEEHGLKCRVMIATRATNPMFHDWGITGTPIYVATRGGHIVESGIAQKRLANWEKLVMRLASGSDSSSKLTSAVGGVST